MTKRRKERRAEDGRKVTGREGRRAREGREKRALRWEESWEGERRRWEWMERRRKERKSKGRWERCALAPCSQKIALILQI